MLATEVAGESAQRSLGWIVKRFQALGRQAAPASSRFDDPLASLFKRAQWSQDSCVMTPDATQTVIICPRCEAMELFDPTLEGVAQAERWLVEHECAEDESTSWSSET